jgi:hypothetical protein
LQWKVYKAIPVRDSDVPGYGECSTIVRMCFLCCSNQKDHTEELENEREIWQKGAAVKIENVNAVKLSHERVMNSKGGR